jgi:hypothetical protein
MHIALLAAAAHAASTNSQLFSTTQGRTSITIYFSGAFSVKCFNICFCRASPSDFAISLAKYVEAVYHTRISVGMRFRMPFETEDRRV